MVRVGVAGVLFLTGCIGSLDGACVVRMGEFAYAHPSKYCKVHDVVGQVSGCTIEWIRIQSGMEGVKMLEERNLDIATIGSTPTTLAISPPLSLDVPPPPPPPPRPPPPPPPPPPPRPPRGAGAGGRLGKAGREGRRGAGGARPAGGGNLTFCHVQ